MGDDSQVSVRQQVNSDEENRRAPEQRGEWNNAMIVEDENVRFSRQPPPPYSPYEIPSVSGAVQLPSTTFIVQPALRHHPVPYTCPTCLQRIITRVEYVNSRKTHMIAGFICGFTIWCMFCCLAAIPYMASSFKKAVHYCPNCKTNLGSH